MAKKGVIKNLIEKVAFLEEKLKCVLPENQEEEEQKEEEDASEES